MAESAATDTTASLPAIQIDSGDGKTEIRNKVWDYLMDHRLAGFPFPAHRRISNFKGAEMAGDKVTALDVFKSAKNVKVDPDKPLQQVRFRTLEASKTLIVPTPRLRHGLFNRIMPPVDGGLAMLKSCATRVGVDEYSEPVGLDDDFHIDLVIVGCVAVSPKGWRIGKGAGFSDMEYAMMVSIGAVNSSVPVITFVHDCQVLDIADSLFEAHDVPVDYIVTPTRVIKCEGASMKRPAGMIWSILDADRVERIPVLGRLRYREWKSGKDVRLSGESNQPLELVDSVPADDEEPPRVGRRRPPRKSGPRDHGREHSDDEPQVNGEVGHEYRVRGRRGFGRGRRRPRQFSRRVADNDRTSENEGDSSGDRVASRRTRGGGRRFRRGFGRRYGGGGRGASRAVENGEVDDSEEERKVGGRGKRRERVSESDGDAIVGRGRGGPRRRGGFGYRRRYFDDLEGSVYVGSLPRFVRVSDFKAQVRDRSVQPLRVVWRGQSGFAFLNFRTVEDAENALTALEGLHISDRSVRLEMAKSSGGGGRRRRRASLSRSDGGGDEATEEA